ncbi:hypothetical protein P7H25_23820 [Paenibacillus larvae]|nr:hypothetical protein [Paenibacillus larvae]MDT2257956.1 hypothetical protein [Paenibacillus larvae]
MTKGRTTTYDERVEIVRFCIEHQLTIMPRQLINSRYPINTCIHKTNKYLTSGVDALQDRRGKRKSEDEMSEVEK